MNKVRVIFIGLLAVVFLAGCATVGAQSNGNGEITCPPLLQIPVEKKVEKAPAKPTAVKVVPIYDPVYFDFDKSNIKDSEKGKLDKIAAYAKEDSAAKFVLEGNCDKAGSEAYNKALGQRRADSAKAYLVSKGVDASRIKTMSFGESKANQKVQTATDRRVDAVNITVTK